jgi:organic hydroperoxide reductase OsmC/OhrA
LTIAISGNRTDYFYMHKALKGPHMHTYEATIAWNRDGQIFTDNRYSRAHEWQFDGGLRVPASSSPLIVPLPMSVAANVDPEEALVAAASSCHMLVFLGLAAKRGFVVDSYVDCATAVMEKNDIGRIAITRIMLHPAILFSGQRVPAPDELTALHHDAHEQCYIANSIKAEITVEAA